MIDWDHDSIRLLTLPEPRKTSDELYLKIKQFLLESISIYPSIEEWWQNRVLPGLRTQERCCQIYLVKDEIVALSITKNSGESSKLCTLRVRESYRSSGLGQSLLRLAFEKMLNNNCRNVHYTISDEVMHDCGDFFTPYGFKLSSWSKNKYVKGKDELLFSVDRRRLLHRINVLEHQWPDRNALLLSIRPSNADLIEQGIKQVEFRRRFSSDWNYARVYFYVTSPVKEIRLTARIREIVKSNPVALWDRFQSQGGVDRKAFFNYFGGSQHGAALFLSNIQAFKKPLRLKSLKMLEGGFAAPQSYRIVRGGEPLFSLMANQKLE